MWESADIAAAERCAHGFAHRNHGFLARGGRILTNVKLDSIGHGKAMPAERDILVVGHSFVSAGAKCRRERQSDLPLERIAGNITHLAANRVEALALALSDFDRQQLEEMAVPVSRTGAGALGPVEQAARHVEPNRSRARRCPC